MSDEDVGFNKDFPLKAGVVEEVMPGLRRVLCGHPSPFTFTGTVSYIVGKGKVALISKRLRRLDFQFTRLRKAVVKQGAFFEIGLVGRIVLGHG